MFCPKCSQSFQEFSNHCTRCGLNLKNIGELLSDSENSKSKRKKFNQTYVNLGLIAMAFGVLFPSWLVALNPFTHPVILLLIIILSFIIIFLCPTTILNKLIKIFTNEEIKGISEIRKNINAGASVMLISIIISLIFAATMGGKGKFFNWLGPAEEVLAFFLCFTTFILANSLFATKIFNYINQEDEEEKFIKQLESDESNKQMQSKSLFSNNPNLLIENNNNFQEITTDFDMVTKELIVNKKNPPQ